MEQIPKARANSPPAQGRERGRSIPLDAGPLLRMRGIDKSFPGVQALDRVDFDLIAGEVHALMGQNGAGKSTLIKVLTAVHRPDQGTILLDGRPFQASSPAHAQRLGVHAVYQEINLVPTLTVAENLFLGRAPRRWHFIDWATMRREARRLLSQFELPIDVNEPLGRLPIAAQQVVAIARAVHTRARLIILDEPTSSLDSHETELLFEVIDGLKSRGLGIVFVTHFLDQVFQIADRITVLRDGRRVGTYDARTLSRADLVAHMLGRPIDSAARLEDRSQRPSPAAAAGAELLGAHRLGRRGGVEPLDLSVRRGEVLGLGGLLGSGRTELARLLFGIDRPDSGTIRVDGKRVKLRSPRRAIARGLGLCPEDRAADGLFPNMSVLANIILVVQRRLSRLGWTSRRAQRRIAERLVAQLGIRTPALHQPVQYLSGGNQQKVILARWLAGAPRLLILDEPTRGIDVGAKAEIERLIEQLSRQGLAIVFISSELEEVARRSDRVLVLRDRRLVGELVGAQIDQHAIMAAIAGDPLAQQQPADRPPALRSRE